MFCEKYFKCCCSVPKDEKLNIELRKETYQEITLGDLPSPNNESTRKNPPKIFIMENNTTVFNPLRRDINPFQGFILPEEPKDSAIQHNTLGITSSLINYDLNKYTLNTIYTRKNSKIELKYESISKKEFQTPEINSDLSTAKSLVRKPSDSNVTVLNKNLDKNIKVIPKRVIPVFNSEPGKRR